MTALEHEQGCRCDECTPPPRTCYNCAAWCNDRADLPADLGQCRRRAPQPRVGLGPEDRWCATAEDDWCLEWSPEPTDPAREQNEILERRNAMLQQVTDTQRAAREDTRKAYERIASVPMARLDDFPAPVPPDGLVKCDGCGRRVPVAEISRYPRRRLCGDCWPAF